MIMNPFRPMLTLLVAALMLTSCGRSIEVKPIAKNSTTEHARRIVVLGGELSETLVTLGAENRIVAVDSTSTRPPRLQKLPNVGYLRQVNVEGVLSLRPDLILASHDAGPAEVLDRWRQLGIEVKQLTTGPLIEQALSAISTLGDIVGESAKAKKLVAHNRRALDTLPALELQPRVLFLLSKAGNLPLVAGTATKAHVMIETAQGHNVAATFSGYKPMTAEAIVKLAPDIILVASHGLASFGGLESLRKDPAVKLTPAGRSGRIQAVDSQLMLSMGPRLGEAVSMLHSAFAKSLPLKAVPQVAQQDRP